MRSWRERLVAAAAAVAAATLAAGCGEDGTGDDPPAGPPGDACETSYLDHASFGEPFLLDWCTGCHSSALPPNMRQQAPADVNFDTLEDARRWAPRIGARATGAMPTMPPAGGPSAEERALLAEWLACGAP
jgi:uncharacterized membrane protein